MRRLGAATLGDLAPAVARPAYDRGAVAIGVVHLGLGAFHRAHQAPVFDDALASGDTRWGIVGVSLRSPAVRDALAPQDGLYTVVSRDGMDEERRLVGAIRRVLVAPEDPAAVVAALADPAVHLVTLTVTEKGYRFGERGLDRDDADVAHDLADLARPRTPVGFLVAGLAARRAAGRPPFTTLSCDNLADNGGRLRGAVLDLAAARDPALAEWIAAQAAFPATMVDRIVPATTAADVERAAAATGLRDEAVVCTEPFRQWVVEDRFCGPRPDLARFGVTLVDEVAPWELAKLRLLNGAHSAIAYLGSLAGIAFVHDFVAAPDRRTLVERLWDEAAATLRPTAGLDVVAYRAALMRRFANPALHHRTRQIAADGSQKIPQRLVAVIAERAARGLASPVAMLAVAGWMRWQRGIDDRGKRFAVDDPLADRTALLATGPAAVVVDALLSLRAVFPATLAADDGVRAGLVEALDRLDREGALAAMAHAGAAP